MDNKTVTLGQQRQLKRQCPYPKTSKEAPTSAPLFPIGEALLSDPGDF